MNALDKVRYGAIIGLVVLVLFIVVTIIVLRS